jgi:SAM-dependent methyltransferase
MTQALDYDSIVAEHGEWTAMAIHLGEGKYTRRPAPDWRLRRLVQIVTDVLGKPLSEARVLDLACLEGHYAIEMALHGARVVATEIREANLTKARYTQRTLGLGNLEFVRDDVRDLRRERLGGFDVVIASGIIYHLDVPAVFEFAQHLYDVCDRLVVIDTQIALTPRVTVQHNGRSYSGMWYQEHEERSDATERYRDFWASIDNIRSLWLTEPSLYNLLADVGFTSILRVEGPQMPGLGPDRQTYVAIKGQRAPIRSSPITDALQESPRPQYNKSPANPVQIQRGSIFRAIKRGLPQPVKNAIKPALRRVGLLPPDVTPEFLKPKR